MMKIIVFGAGLYGQKFIQTSTDNMQVLAVADNNASLWARRLLGHRIINPACIVDMDYDLIVIAIDVDAGDAWLKMYQSILSQLIDMGVPDDQIALQSVANLPTSPRIVFFRHLAEQIRNFSVDGAVAECGIYRGWSAHYINKYFPDRKMYLFDSFTGFDERDIQQESHLKTHEWLTQDHARAYFKRGSREISVRRCYFRKNIIVREGHVPDTFDGLENEKFAFVNLDMDLYKPQYEALMFFGFRMSKGGVICLHDYYHPKLQGTQQAVDEFAKGCDFNRIPIGDGSSIALVFNG